MLPPKIRLPAEQQQLLDLFRRLSPIDQHSLSRYAEFLAARSDSVNDAMVKVAQAPKNIPRPESESVIAAIRRLSDTFHMLERDVLLHETSALMTAHVMQGRPAPDVIDDLEALFRRHYEQVDAASE